MQIAREAGHDELFESRILSLLGRFMRYFQLAAGLYNAPVMHLKFISFSVATVAAVSVGAILEAKLNTEGSSNILVFMLPAHDVLLLAECFPDSSLIYLGVYFCWYLKVDLFGSRLTGYSFFQRP